MTEFVHLRVSSIFSMLQSMIDFDRLAQSCIEYKMPAVAIADDNNMFGVVEFSEAMKKHRIKPIIGSQINIKVSENQAPKPLVFLAQNKIGYQNLIKLSTQSHFNGKNDCPYLPLSYLNRENTDHIICLSGGNTGLLAHMIHLRKPQSSIDEVVNHLRAIFDQRFYIELHRHSSKDLQYLEDMFLQLAQKYDLPPVATNDCMFPARDCYEAHDVMLCIKYNKKIADADRIKYTPNHYFKSQEEMCELFRDIPEALQNSVEIFKRCSYVIETSDPVLPPFSTKGKETEKDMLIKQSKEGLSSRLKNHIFPRTEPADHKQITKKYTERLNKELTIITNMHYEGYFLIVADMVQWAKKNDIAVGPGRGSGAGSLVAWCLNITEVDPIEFDLIFERFLNPQRVSLPDFDIDFCQENRDRVINYICEKYGKDRVGQIITFGTLQARAVIRDTGRVLGLPFTVTDRICKLIPHNPNHPVTLAECVQNDKQIKIEISLDPTIEKMISISIQLEGLPRHASVHAAGIVIGNQYLQNILPLSYDPQSDLPITQFNMTDIARIGLIKFDLLGLKTLTLLTKVRQLVNQTQEAMDIDLQDRKTFDLFCSGETTGIFQFESAGMRNLLTHALPSNIHDIMALVALFRPGPMEHIDDYIKARHGEIVPQSLHPIIDHIVQETYGVIVYQEQVMQIAVTLANYTTEKADLLRRAMGKKIKSEMDAQEQDFIAGAMKNGIDKSLAKDIFDLIARFASYGFNKSHAACYALLSYFTAWYKANYPTEFLCTAMNMESHDPEKLLNFRQELDRLGICLLPPDINLSGQNFKIEYHNHDNPKIRFGLAAIKNLGQEISNIIIQERTNHGCFVNLADFLKRLPKQVLNKRQMESLVASGALMSLYDDQGKMINNVDSLMKIYNRDSRQGLLFQNQTHDLDKELSRSSNISYFKLAKEESAVLHSNLIYNPLSHIFKILKGIQAYDYNRFVHSNNRYAYMPCNILHVSHRRNNKGRRFAILIVQDLKRIFSIRIQEEVVNKYINQLKPGNLVVIKCQKYDVKNISNLVLVGEEIIDITTYLKKHIVKINIQLHRIPKPYWLKANIPTGSGSGAIRVMLQFPSPDNMGYYVSIRLTLKPDLTLEDLCKLIHNSDIKDIEFISKQKSLSS